MSNSPVIAFLNKMTDLIVLNILYLICCLPIFTIGAANTAMYYVCIRSIREGDGYVWRRFLQSFKNNFKQATIIWIPMLVIGVLMTFDLLFWYRMETDFAKVMFVLSAVLAFVMFIIAMYIFPILSKCEGNNITLIRNAAAFAIGYLPYTLILLVITIAFVWLNVISIGMNVISLFIGMALCAYIKSFFIYRIMMKHMDERYDDFELNQSL